MQRIGENRIEEEYIGFAEAMVQTLLLRLNCNNIYPRCVTQESITQESITQESCCEMCFDNEIIDYRIIISEHGSCLINLNANSVDFIEVSDSNCIFNPLYDPESIMCKLVRAAMFIRSLKDHMSSANSSWLIEGIRSVINGSKEIYTYPPFNPMRLKLFAFQQEFMGRFPHK